MGGLLLTAIVAAAGAASTFTSEASAAPTPMLEHVERASVILTGSAE